MKADDTAKLGGRLAANEKRGGIAVFLALTLSFSSIFYFLIAKSGHVGGGWGAYIGCLMWCPGVAALLTCKYLGRDVSSLGWSWGKSRYQVVCYLIPLAYGAAIYAFVWLTGFGGFYNSKFVERFSEAFGLGPMRPWVSIVLYFLFTATITVVRDCATVLGEEIGWRGFLVPELAKRYSFAATAIISGLIWALWHYPIFLLAGRLQRRHTSLVLPSTVHCVAPGPQLCVDMDEAQVRQSLAWCHIARRTQYVRARILRSAHGRQPQNQVQCGTKFACQLVVSILMAIYFWTRRDEVRLATRAVTFSE